MRDARTWVKFHTTDAERQGYKKSLNIPKGLSESVNRRTDNTKAKRKRTIIELQNTHKTQDRVKRTPLKLGEELRCSGK